MDILDNWDEEYLSHQTETFDPSHDETPKSDIWAEWERIHPLRCERCESVAIDTYRENRTNLLICRTCAYWSPNGLREPIGPFWE